MTADKKTRQAQCPDDPKTENTTEGDPPGGSGSGEIKTGMGGKRKRGM